RRRHHLGVLGDRQRLVGDAAEDQGDHREDGGEDRSVDEEPGDVHRRRSGAGSVVEVVGSAAATVAGWWAASRRASHLPPGRIRCSPATTIHSAGVSPSRTTRRPSTSGPSLTWRYSVFPSPSTT